MQFDVTGIIPLYKEEFLPCRIPEISLNRKRKKIEKISSESRHHFKHKAILRRTHFGWSLESGGMLLLASLKSRVVELGQEGLLHSSLSDQDILFLEVLNAYDLLSNEMPNEQLTIYDVSEKYLALYDGEEFGWFNYSPSKISIDLTSKCNAHCIHCSRDANKVAAEIDREALNSVLQQGSKLGVNSLSLMGGEPTIYPDFIAVARYASELGYQNIATSTNGIALTELLVQEMAEIFTQVQVSIHGSSNSMHERVTQVTHSFKSATAAVEKLASQNVSVVISCTVFSAKRDEIFNMVKLADFLGAKSIRFLGLFEQGRACDMPTLSKADRLIVRDWIEEAKEQYEGVLTIHAGGFPAAKSPKKYACNYGCPAGREILNISAEGQIGPCANIDWSCGSIYTDKLGDVWHSEDMRQIRKKMKCDCAYTAICAGPCLANDGFLGREYDVNDYF